jgi:hypothetical protein
MPRGAAVSPTTASAEHAARVLGEIELTSSSYAVRPRS